MLGCGYLSRGAEHILAFFLARGPKWLTLSPAKIFKKKYGTCRNTTNKYMRELKLAGHAARVFGPDPSGRKGGLIWFWKYSERPFGIDAKKLDREWQVHAPQYGTHGIKAASTIPIRNKMGEYRLGFEAATFNGLRPGADFYPNNTYGTSCFALEETTVHDDGTVTKIIHRTRLEKTPDQTPVPDETIYVPKKKVKAKKTKRVKAVSKASSNEEPEHKVVARKSTKKLVKSSSDTTPEIVETTGNSEAVLTTTDVVFSAETECPKNEHLSKEHSSRTIGRRLSSSPYTYAHKKKMTSRAMFKGKKLELRHSVQFSLPDDPNDKQPDLGPDGSYTYGLNGRGYRKLKCDQLPELVLFEAIGTVHEVKEQPATPEPAPLVANKMYDVASKILVYPETDLPGSPPIVLSHDGVWLHMLGRAAAIPDAVLEPHKFPAVKKYKVDDSEQLMIVPGYAFKVARFLVRDTLHSLRQKLGRDARHNELYAALDSIRLSDYADLLDVKDLCPAQVVESCGTQAPESCVPQDAESFMVSEAEIQAKIAEIGEIDEAELERWADAEERRREQEKSNRDPVLAGLARDFMLSIGLCTDASAP